VRRKLAFVLAALALVTAGWLLAPRRHAGRLDDLDADPVATLRALPHAAGVRRDGPAGRPEARVVHLQDWHLIPEDLHRLDAGRHGPSYASHLADVEGVQAEQAELLRALARAHGVRRVFVEGLTPSGVKAWAARVDVLRDALGLQAELRQMLREAEGRGAADLADKARSLLAEPRRDRLELGAAGLLQAQGELDEAAPLDDDEALDAADPRRQPGAGRTPADGRREAAIVRRALSAGPPLVVLVVLVLGGHHDLGEALRRQGGGRVEYLRVATKRYRDLAGR
jgi:hypothetical protein